MRKANLLLVACNHCGMEWGPADMNRAGICPGCVEELSKPAPEALDMETFRACKEAERRRMLREAAERQRLLIGRELALPYGGGRPLTETKNAAAWF